MADRLMIETRKLTRRFGDLTAVDGIDLSVTEGTIHGFVGPNGAGKTTTIKMLIGALRPSDGNGWIRGQPIGSTDARATIGYCPERPFFYDDMPALDYLVYMARLCDVSGREAVEKARQLLDWLDLGGFVYARAGGFSAGMKQRLGLAQALIHDPELLILDEPTANMDPTGRLSILDKLKELSQERGVTIFLSSHILSELEQIVDSLTMIDHGRIVVSGQMEELRKRFSGNHYLIRTSNNAVVLQGIQGKGYVREAWLDDEDGFVHAVSDEGHTLRRRVLDIVVQQGLDLQHLSEERVDLQSIYRKTMGMKEE